MPKDPMMKHILHEPASAIAPKKIKTTAFESPAAAQTWYKRPAQHRIEIAL